VVGIRRPAFIAIVNCRLNGGEGEGEVVDKAT
jgi:hypothetical protein